jgi:hypothetical protein
MAVLSDSDRTDLWAAFMRGLSDEGSKLDVTKSELRATVDALDDFLHANAAAINSAIPAGPRARLTIPQKARLLMFVIRQRYLKGA